jgi:hypothetical protein
MVSTPQIFLYAIPGTFGTFIAHILQHHPLCYKFYNTDKKVTLGDNPFNAHSTENRIFKEFECYFDYSKLIKSSNKDIQKTFETDKEYNLGVNRQVSYVWNSFPYEKYFSHFVKVFIIPKKERLPYYANRQYKSNVLDSNGHIHLGEYMRDPAWTDGAHIPGFYFMKNLKKKNILDYPKKLLSGLAIKEYLKFHENEHKKIKSYNFKNDIVFDPDDLGNVTKVTNLCNAISNKLKIAKFPIPKDKIIKHMERNKDINFIDLE